MNGWCNTCSTGYVASLEVPSFELFETLDAHGHDIDPARISCASCQKAIADDGLCEVCRMGYVKGQLYMSPLTYYLARSELRRVSDISCATCRENAAAWGWCDSCGVGRVGRYAFASREDMKGARRAIDILKGSLARLERCESCAVASFAGGRCPECDIRYRDGEAVLE